MRGNLAENTFLLSAIFKLARTSNNPSFAKDRFKMRCLATLLNLAQELFYPLGISNCGNGFFPPTLLKLFWILKIGSENQTGNTTCLLLRRLTLRFLRNISSTAALAFQSQWQIFLLHPEDWQLHSAVTTPECLDLSCTFTTLSASEPSHWSLWSNSVHLSLASSFSGKITYHCWCISTDAAVVPHQLLLCGRSKAAKDVRTLEAKAKK